MSHRRLQFRSKALTKFLVVVSCLTILLAASVALAGQNYPGAALFSFQCGTGIIAFSYQGTTTIQVSLAQISGPLSTAIWTQQNQPIVYGNTVSLWALKSNELQIHVNSNPDGTKLVLSSGICGAIPVSTSGSVLNQAGVFVQSSGSGQALAYAQVSPSGQVTVFAETIGPAQASAYAQSVSVPYSQGGMRMHVVLAGENLFRIALWYHTTVAILAALNNIPDPSLIYVGQVLYIP